MKQIKFLSFGCTTVGFFLALAVPALAAQCAYISKEQALKAIARLDIDEYIYLLCEPCGEEIPELAKISNLSMNKVDYGDYWEIKVNDKGIDLAYVFVDSEADHNFISLAAIADCPVRNVNPILPSGKAIKLKGQD